MTRREDDRQPTGSQNTHSTPDLLATTRNSASHPITWFEAARHTLVVGLSLVVALTGCDYDNSLPSHPTGATAIAAVSTPGSIPEGDAAIEPGTYRIPKSAWSVANFTVTFPEGWTVQYGHVYANQSDEDAEFGFYAVVVDEIFTEGCAGSNSGLTELGPGVDDLAEALLAQAGPTKNGPADTTLGGYPATRIELTVPEGFDLKPCNAADIGLQIWYSPPADKNFVLLADHTASVYIVDVNGARQVFVAQHPTTTSDAERAELQSTLDSIRIEEPAVEPEESPTAASVQASTTQPSATTTSTTEPPSTTTTVPPGWSGAIRDPSDVDQSMVLVTEDPPYGPSILTWIDPVDAPTGWVDVERVQFEASLGFGDGEVIAGATQPYWWIELAAKPPLVTELEPGLVIAYGLVLETSGDGVADYLIGIDNEAPNPGDYRVWVTDLAAGETDLQIGPYYGWPIEFVHPDEQQPGDALAEGRPRMVFTFLDGGPADMSFEQVRFYVWTSATRGDEVLANDFVPDIGWLTADSRALWDAQKGPYPVG